MPRNNVLHITHTNPYKDSRILNIAESVSIIGDDFNQYIIGLNRDKIFKSHKKRIKIISVNLRSRALPIFFKTIRKLFLILEFNITLLIKCFLIKPKIIHCHDLSGLYVGVIAKLIFKSKFIFDAHELEAQQPLMSPLEHVLITIYEFIPVLFCDNLITVSESIALWYQWKGAKKISIIFNKPKLEKSKIKVKKTLLEKIPPVNKGINLLYIGTLVKERSIESLLNEFKNNPKYNLYFLGEGPLEKVIKKIIIKSNNIYLHPFVDKDEVIHFIKGFDYSICMNEKTSLSSYFSMPNKLFQSLASGIPIIISNNPDSANFINQNKYGIIAKKVEDIMNLIESNLYKTNDFKKNIKRDNKNFIWDNEFNKLKDIYS